MYSKLTLVDLTHFKNIFKIRCHNPYHSSLFICTCYWYFVLKRLLLFQFDMLNMSFLKKSKKFSFQKRHLESHILIMWNEMWLINISYFFNFLTHSLSDETGNNVRLHTHIFTFVDAYGLSYIGSFPTAIRTPNPHIVIVVTISTRIKVGVFVTNSKYYNFPE